MAIVLRPAELVLATAFNTANPVTLRNGDRDPDRQRSGTRTGWSRARDGVTVAANLSATPAGIVSFEPARVNLRAEQGSAVVQVRGTTVGSAVIRLTPPEGISVSGIPLAISVTP